MPREVDKLEELLERKDTLVFLILKHYQLDFQKLDMLVQLNILDNLVLVLTTVVAFSISVPNIDQSMMHVLLDLTDTLMIHVLLDLTDSLGLLVDTLPVAVIYLAILASKALDTEPTYHKDMAHMDQVTNPESADTQLSPQLQLSKKIQPLQLLLFQHKLKKQLFQ